MAFSRAKTSGWAFGEILTSAQMNSLDIDHTNAVDGAAGGNYALSGPLHFSGNTVTIDTLAAATVTTTGNATLGNSSGDVTTVRQLHALNDVTVDGTTDVQGLLVHDQAFFDLDVDVSAALSSSSLTVAGTGNILGQLQFLFKNAAGVNADHAYNTLDAGQIIFVETLSANHAYTFSGSFDAGQWFLFKHHASGGATLTVNGTALTVGEAVLWVYNGTNWRSFRLDE